MSAVNDYNCSDTVTQNIHIVAQDPDASFSVDKTSGCMPLMVTFNNISAYANTYTWDFDNGTFSDMEDPIYTFDSSGTYQVTLNTLGDCETSSVFSKLITVYPSPNADFVVEPDTVAVDQLVGFFNESTGGLFYLWNFSNGQGTVEQTPRLRFTEPGFYDVKLTITSENGCIDSLTKKNSLYVINDLYFKYPTGFTPNNDQNNDELTPYYNMVEECQVTIYNRLSQVVFYTDDGLNEFWDGTKMNGKKCAQEVYVWKATGKYINGQVFTEVGSVTLLR